MYSARMNAIYWMARFELNTMMRGLYDYDSPNYGRAWCSVIECYCQALNEEGFV